MKIKTMKDLKKALSKIPDNVLVNFGIGSTEEGIELGVQISNDCAEDMKYYKENADKYPAIRAIGKYFYNITNIISEGQEDTVDDFISNED